MSQAPAAGTKPPISVPLTTCSTADLALTPKPLSRAGERGAKLFWGVSLITNLRTGFDDNLSAL